MNKNKILTGTKSQSGLKMMGVQKKQKPKFNLSTKTVGKKDLKNLDTSRTNKQNVIEKTQLQTPKTSRYFTRYEQKKEYLSQSMVLAEIPHYMTSKSSSRVTITDKGEVNEARNELRNLLSIDEDIESNIVTQSIDTKDIIQSLIYESIIQSQKSTIRSLQTKISQLTHSLQAFNQPKHLSFYQTTPLFLQPTPTLQTHHHDKLQQQITLLTRQTDSLKKQILNYRKDNILLKKQLSTLKKTHQTLTKQLDIIKINYETSQQQLQDRTIWLTTLKFQNQQLLKQPNQIIIQLNEQKEKLIEYIYGINKANDYLSIKLNSFKRDSQLELKDVRMKHNEEMKKLREKLRKKTSVREKKKKILEIKVEEENLDDSIDWNLEQEEGEEENRTEVVVSC